MTAIDEHRELDAARAPVSEERVKGSADGAAGIEHVVAQDHMTVVDVQTNVSFAHHRAYVVGAEVVAVKTDVEHAGRNRTLHNSADQHRQSFSQGNAAA